MNKPVRVLFVAHDAYRAGATIFLLNMLRWMREHTQLKFDVALREDGDMVGEFEKVCPAFVLTAAAPSGLLGHLRSCWQRWRPLRRRRTLRSLVRSGNYDLLYLNTITLGDHLARLEDLSLPVITHVHELGYVIQRYAHGQERLVLERSERVICVSDAVVRDVVGQFGCPMDRIRRVYGFTPVDVRVEGSPQERRARLLGPLGLPHDAWVIGVCGHGSMLKGVDLAVPLLRLLPAHIAEREIHLVWVGSERAEYPRDMALSDARKAGVAGRLHFPGITRAPADWISVFDLHLLLSREDPFPLVTMEAATFGVPTVAFGDAGGAAEFIGSDAGACVPFLDLPAMAKALVEVLASETKRQALGEAARVRVRQRHAPDVVLPEIVQVIEEMMTERRMAGPVHGTRR